MMAGYRWGTRSIRVALDLQLYGFSVSKIAVYAVQHRSKTKDIQEQKTLLQMSAMYSNSSPSHGDPTPADNYSQDCRCSRLGFFSRPDTCTMLPGLEFERLNHAVEHRRDDDGETGDELHGREFWGAHAGGGALGARAGAGVA